MLKKITPLIFLFFLSNYANLFAQDISLYTQVNGRYDFTFVGNTMNTAENNPTNS